jgi:putative transposase
MRKYGLNACGRRKFIPATDSGHGLAVCENLPDRDFRAAGPGEKRVSGITCLRTAGGRLCLTAVLDLYGRKITGRAFSGTAGAEETAVKALETAAGNRKPRPGPLFHSSRGLQYCPALFRETLDGRRPAAAVRASVFQYIEAYYNRIHSALDCLAPVMVTLKKVA